MDEEMHFPNPVPRPSREIKPVRHTKRWIALGAIVILVLTIVFLPNLLGTKVGRIFVRKYLASHFHAVDASVPKFHTRWFDGTSAEQCWIILPDGHKIGFVAMQSEISLWSLLRHHYNWGKTNLYGFYADYVINNGHGDSTLNLLGERPEIPGQPPPIVLPQFSGDFTFTHSTLVLYRGLILPQLTTEMRNVHFVNMRGTVTIKSLDQPFDFNLKADTIEGNPPYKGETEGDNLISIVGHAALGKNGNFSPADMQCELQAKGERQPLGAMAAVFFKFFPRADWSRMLGDDGSASFGLSGKAGHLNAGVNLQSSVAQGKLTSAIDLTSGPAMIEFRRVFIDGGGNGFSNTIIPSDLRLGASASLCRGVLAEFNPLLIDAADDPVRPAGSISLSVPNSLSFPLELTQLRQGLNVSGSIDLSAEDVPLAIPDARPDPSKRALVTDVCLLLGIYESPTLMQQTTRYAIEKQKVDITSATGLLDQLPLPADLKLSNHPLALSDTTTLSGTGTVDAKLGLTVDGIGPVTVPITGPVASPRVPFAQVAASLGDNGTKLMGIVEDHAAEMRRRATARAVQSKEQ